MDRASDTYEDICMFCCEIRGEDDSNLFFDLGLARESKDYVLHETEHFVVMPCIGALTDWYVLIVSKRHALSVGWLSAEERDDLKRVLSHVRRKLENITGHQTMVFEHGSYDFRDKGGACYDHAHVHVVATERSLDEFMGYVPSSLEMARCEDWTDEATQMVQNQHLSYLALENPTEKLIGIATGAPSQFFRRCLSRWLGADDGEWDWLVYPQLERVKRMAQTKW
jgi:diadenosine tetraphosphate (Ap4A) HIT family hydrolase